MTLIGQAVWLWNQTFAWTELLGEASGILVLLAAAVLIYRTFRERYLFIWIFGWVLYLVYREANLAGSEGAGPFWQSVAHTSFILSVSFFCAAALFYTNSRRYLLPVGILAAAAINVAVMRAYWFPLAMSGTIAVHALYRVITVVGAIRLALFSRGRSSSGPWLMTGMLLLMHMDEISAVPHLFSQADVVLEMLLGLSMLMTVLDDSKSRTERLEVLNSIATAIADARDTGGMLTTCLTHLQRLTGAKAVFVRMLEGDRMVLAHSVGLSERFQKERHALTAAEHYSARLLSSRTSAKLRVAGAEPWIREGLVAEGFDHVLLVPLAGKTAVIGILALGMPVERSYTSGELRFLETTANQLGLAIENLRMLEQVVRSQRQWVSTFDSIEDLVIVHDLDGNIQRVNRAMLMKLGRGDMYDAVGRHCSAVLPNTTLGCPYCLRSDQPVTDEADPCFGGYSLVSTSSYTESSAGTGIVHVIRDTSQLRAAEERYRLLFEEVQEGVFISTPDGRLLECNEAFVRMLGYQSRAQLLAQDIATKLYASPNDRTVFLAQMKLHGFVRNYEATLVRSDGSNITLMESSFATRRPDGTIDRIQGFLVDITEKKKAEQEIRRHNRELNAMNRMAVIANQSFDLDEILGVTLRQCVELFSAETGAVLLFEPGTRLLRRRASWGHRINGELNMREYDVPPEFWDRIESSRTELITPQHLQHLPEFVQKFVAEEGLRAWRWVVLWSKDKPLGVLGISNRSEREFSQMDDNLLIAIARQLATTIEKVRLYDATSKAYDDLRRTQEQLLQSEKMSAVGQLISGVAHELNNPLTAILGYAQLLENEPLGERARDFIQKLYKQTQRTHRVVQNLLSFARQRKPQKQPVDVRRVIEDTLALRDYDLKLNNIVVDRKFERELPHVTADPHQLEQVFLNIVNNAADAMLEVARGGHLTVSVSRQDGHVVTEFHDSGPGMRDPKKVFDPFYTTKKIGKGTGLGLSICYGITKEHGGEIEAANHESGGAVFRVLLPVSESERTARPVQAVSADNRLQCRVLLVDDEDAVLEFEREVLTGAGAEVVALSRGEDAIALLQNETFDAILLDGKMPGGWSGMSIYEWVHENRPGLEKRIVMTLSHASEAETRSFLERNNTPCLIKPFEVSDLLSMVRRVSQKALAASAN